MSAPSIYAPDTSAAVVRYQVGDLERSVSFYTQRLGFHSTNRAGPIAVVARGALNLLLSGPTASGSRPTPNAQRQEPGGWNRIVLYVDDIAATIATLTAAGTHFRNDLQEGPGGKQILLDDPDGNPVELHEAPRAS